MHPRDLAPMHPTTWQASVYRTVQRQIEEELARTTERQLKHRRCALMDAYLRAANAHGGALPLDSVVSGYDPLGVQHLKYRPPKSDPLKKEVHGAAPARPAVCIDPVQWRGAAAKNTFYGRRSGTPPPVPPAGARRSHGAASCFPQYHISADPMVVAKELREWGLVHKRQASRSLAHPDQC